MSAAGATNEATSLPRQALLDPAEQSVALTVGSSAVPAALVLRLIPEKPQALRVSRSTPDLLTSLQPFGVQLDVTQEEIGKGPVLVIGRHKLQAADVKGEAGARKLMSYSAQETQQSLAQAQISRRTP